MLHAARTSRRTTPRSPAAPAAAPGVLPPLRGLQHAAGNRAFGALLRRSAESPLEREADRLAHTLARTDRPAPTSTAGGSTAPRVGVSEARTAPGPGRPLPEGVRAHFEPRLGADLRHVRVHTGAAAERQAAGLGARAFAHGSDIVFGKDAYAPHTAGGRHVLGHELTHVVQQTHGPPGRDAPVRERAPAPLVSRLDASLCASDCAAPDGVGTATGKFTLTLYADREGPFLFLPLTHKVGHAWVRLEDDAGRFWTFGFWPQEGYDASDVHADVAGCVHHPDTAHTATSSQTFELTAAEFAAAMDVAVTTCKARPAYNLFGLQCTEFAKRVAQAAGKNVGGFGLIWESPNALDSWLRTNALIIGLSVTAAGPDPYAGSVAFDARYVHQFASLFGNQFRFFGTGRLELGSRIQFLAPGVGMEFNPQIVWLPVPYVTALAPLGIMGEGPQGERRFGAGLGVGAGMRYNVDEIGVIGVEWNLLKDFVNQDPALHRMMMNVGVRF